MRKFRIGEKVHHYTNPDAIGTVVQIRTGRVRVAYHNRMVWFVPTVLESAGY